MRRRSTNLISTVFVSVWVATSALQARAQSTAQNPALTMPTADASAARVKKRIAVLDFEFGAVQRWWDWNWDIGKGVTDLVVDRMVNEGTYSVIERKKLNTMLAEQDFSNSERADPSTASKIGKVVGVNVIVVGSITQFGTEKKSFKIGGVFGALPGIGAVGVGTQKGKARVAITARFIDVSSGEILASVTGKGESKRSGLILGGGGAGSGGFGGAGMSMTTSDFRDTVLGEATHAAVDDAVRQMIAFKIKVPDTKVEVRGLIADVTGQTVILNIGKTQGVQVGSTLKVLRALRSIKDPETGKVLREITHDVGQVRINEVEDGSASGTIISGTAVKVGDLVRS